MPREMLRRDAKPGTVFRYLNGEHTFYTPPASLETPDRLRGSYESCPFMADLNKQIEVLWEPKGPTPAEPEVTNQPHYAELKPEPIDVIESWGLGYNLASALAYIARHGRKHAAGDSQDLR